MQVDLAESDPFLEGPVKIIAMKTEDRAQAQVVLPYFQNFLPASKFHPARQLWIHPYGGQAMT